MRLLTVREQEILRLLAGGMEYKQIAVILGCRTRTIHAHVQSAKKKAGVSGTPGRLVFWWREHESAECVGTRE